ncbi:MAG: flippase [Ignavibacteriae bacterium]|nr:flippase [Ignavibacteriota bacterium]
MASFKRQVNFKTIKAKLQGGNFRQITDNFLSLSTVQLLGYIFPLIILPYLVHTIGTEKFGLTETAASFLGIFTMITNYGFPYSASRQIAIARDSSEKVSEIFSAVITLKSIFMLFSFIVLFLLTFFVSKFNQEKVLYLWSFGIVAGDVLFPIWLFQGLEQMRYISLLNLSTRAVILLLTILFVRSPEDYIFVPLVNSVGQIFIGIASIYIAHYRLNVKFTIPKIDHLKFQLKEGWNTFISGAAINFYTQSRVFIFSLFVSKTLVGYYSLAQRVAGMFQVYPIATLLNATLPRLNHLYSTNKQKSIELLRKMQRYSNYYTLAAAPICFILAPQILRLVTHESIPESIVTFRILIVSVTIANMNIFRVHYFIISGNYSLFSQLHTIASFIGIMLMLVLTNFYLHIGMAIAITLLELGIFITTFILTRSYFHKELQ